MRHSTISATALGVSFAVLWWMAPSVRAADPPPSSRLWKDSQGRFEIQGTVVRSTEQSVTLKRSGDGREILLSLDRLSSDDQQYIQALRKNRSVPQVEKQRGARDSLVAVAFTMRDSVRLATGVVIHKDRERAYVLASTDAPDYMVEGSTATVYWRLGEQVRSAVASTISYRHRSADCLIAIPVADTPAALPLTPVAACAMDDVTLEGYRFDDQKLPPKLELTSTAATIARVWEKQRGLPIFQVQPAGAPAPSGGLVLAADGTVVGFLPRMWLRGAHSYEAHRLTREEAAAPITSPAIPIARLADSIRPEVARVSVKAREEGGQIKLDLTILVADIQGNMGEASLRVADVFMSGSNQDAFAPWISGAWQPLPQSNVVELRKSNVEPDAKEVKSQLSKLPWAAMYVGTCAVPRRGAQAIAELQIQLQWTDASSRQVHYSPPVEVHYHGR